jgi:hypothetical protein
MSGEALNRTPSVALSPRTKIDDCVRGLARIVPERRPEQLRQLQFHCGKPPPAAEPRTVIRIVGVFDKKMSPPAVKRSGDWGSANHRLSARRRTS